MSGRWAALTTVVLLATAACTRPTPAPKAAPPVLALPAVPAAPAVQTATLTGLYEFAAGARRNQLCMIERPGRTSFGIVAWSSGDRVCSGFGRAERQGNGVRLTMEGDSSCVIDVRLEGRRLSLPSSLPQGCAYYCAPGAQMSEAGFDKTGGSAEDALRATDLAGNRLCG